MGNETAMCEGERKNKKRYLHFSFSDHSTTISGHSSNNRSIFYQCLQLPNSKKPVQQSPAPADRGMPHVGESRTACAPSLAAARSDRTRIQGYKLVQSRVNAVGLSWECTSSAFLWEERGNRGLGPNLYNKLLKRDLIEVYKS